MSPKFLTPMDFGVEVRDSRDLELRGALVKKSEPTPGHLRLATLQCVRMELTEYPYRLPGQEGYTECRPPFGDPPCGGCDACLAAQYGGPTTDEWAEAREPWQLPDTSEDFGR